MDGAATGEAAGGQESRPGYTTDRGTLARVAEVLHGQLGGKEIVVLLVRERPTSAGEPMECRTYVPLHHRPAGAR